MMNNKQSLSDLLDDQCSSADLDALLKDRDSNDTWYRFQSVSAIIKDEHSAHTCSEFYNQISEKIALEPAIISAPKANQQQSKNNDNVIQFKRLGGGFAIAASAAFATFISVQTLQVAEHIEPQGQTFAVDRDSRENTVSPNVSKNVEVQDSLEQSELDMFNFLYLREASSSGRGGLAPVGSKYVKTYRFSAEQWQKLMEDAASQKQVKPSEEKLEKE